MGRPPSDPVRNNQIAEMYRSGISAAKIGPHFNLTMHGVLYLLRRLSVNRSEGGRAVAAQKAAAIRADKNTFKRALMMIERYGARLSAFESFDAAQLAIQRFLEQRSRAHQRKIGWELTFADWWEIWSESGAWARRGRENADSAVMARNFDAGPYSVGNVSIISLSKNLSDSWSTAPDRIHGGRLRKLRSIAS